MNTKNRSKLGQETEQKPFRKPGEVKEISSLSNPLIKDLKALALKKNREATGTFLAEGLQLVMNGIEANWPVHTLVYCEAMQTNEHLMQVAAKVRNRGALILKVSEKVLVGMTRRNNPHMVVAQFCQYWHTLESITADQGKNWVVLEQVRDPGNLGTIIRTCAAAGMDGIIMIGDCTDAYSMESVRATMGSIFNVPLYHCTLDIFLQWHRTWSGKSWGTHLSGKIDYRSVDYSIGPNLILMGNEQTGLSDRLAECCNQLVCIGMAKGVDSLNLSVATGIMLFEVRRLALKIGNIV